MVQKTNKTKSRLGREFKGEYTDTPIFIEDEITKANPKVKKDLVDIIRNRKMGMGEGKAELLDSLIKKASEEIKYVFEVGDKVEGLPKPRNLELAKKREFPDWRKKEMFFQHLNNVMATKLVKPSIIIEYVNQYQRGDK